MFFETIDDTTTFTWGLKLDNLSTNFDKRSNNPNEVHINLVITSNCKVLDQINDE
jgi:hypothetical protein